jgi:magnesium transporter
VKAGLVFNTAFATLVLKEPFTRFSLVGTILTCVGAAIIATFGAISEPAHTLSQLLDLLGQRQFIWWMVVTMLIAIGTIVFAHMLKMYTKRTRREAQDHEPGQVQSRSMSSSYPDLSSLKRSITTQLPPILQNRISRIRLVRGLAYALISGILSAHSLLVAKTAVELLVRTIVDHQNQFNRYQSWLILAALVFFALTQLYYLHLGLRLCSTSVLYPFVFCIYNIIAILDGLIYFRQGSRLSTLHAGLIAIGTVVLLTGVLALSWRLDDSISADSTALQTAETESFNPLAPGLGLMRSSDDSPLSPLLPQVRPRSSTSVSRHSVDEQTPLLYQRLRRAPTLNVYPPPPDPGTKNILAELDDEDNESDHDFLASLPRAPSPHLTQTNYAARRRSRGHSLSSVPTTPFVLRGNRGSGGRTDSAGYQGPKRALSSRSAEEQKDRRRSSAPGWTGGESEAGSDPRSKSTSNLHRPSEVVNGSAARAATTAEHKDGKGDGYETEPSDRTRSVRPATPSKWDMGWSRWWRGEDKQDPGDQDPGG